jgi:hypothetical protein
MYPQFSDFSIQIKKGKRNPVYLSMKEGCLFGFVWLGSMAFGLVA